MNNGNISKAPTQKREMSTLSKFYLLSYNGIQTVGWGYVLLKTLKFLFTSQPTTGIWDLCNPSLTIFQSLAVLEVLHCAVGLVPSSVITTACQVASRVFMIWGVLVPIEQSRSSPTLSLMIFAWSVTEVIRYSYYLAHLTNVDIKYLTWARYSLFMGLYPMGISGELGTTWAGLETIRRTRFFSLMLPNKANFSFNYHIICMIVMLSYVPLSPILYSHMLRQRRKTLGKSITENGASKKSH